VTGFTRRRFLETGLMTPVAAAASPVAGEAAGTSAKKGEAMTADSGANGVTRTLAQYVLRARYGDLPEKVRKEGLRTLLNYVGVAVGSSGQDNVRIAIKAIAPFAGPAQATILGRHERFDILNAAFVNGVSSHIFDFDDTHLKTIIHPGGPVISALLACAEYRPVHGKEFLNALVLGVETCCRIGNAVYPNHYDVGWHITGTAGVFGAAAGVGKLLNLSEQQMVWALGLAASQPVGLREAFGSMTKSFNPGRAAENGLFAALLAQDDYTSSDSMIEAKRGWANTVSTKQDYREITEGLGERYEAALNTYKPFACGIVEHPSIDATIQLRDEFRLTADQIESIELKVNPLVLELTGKRTPQTGLEGKFSIYHCVAVALIQGAAGQKQFQDSVVRDPQVVALRQRVFAAVDASIVPEQADVTIHLRDGRVLHKFIAHAIGSVEAPMTDAQLEAKFLDLVDGILSPAQAHRLIEACWNLEKLDDAATIAQLAVPG
jgi:2-methylcitrate dehydratase PrpD